MNPALPSGASSLTDTAKGGSTWAFTARFTGGYMAYPYQTQDGVKAENPFDQRLTIGLGTVDLALLSKWNLSVAAQVPFGVVDVSSVKSGHADYGFADMEARARYSLFYLSRKLEVSAALGGAFPTGLYVPKNSVTTSFSDNRSLGLGRGISWFLGDLELRVRPLSALVVFLNGASRLALHEASDGYQWGPELRASAGVQYAILPSRLSAVVAADVQWRAMSTELDADGVTRYDSVNTGGTTWNVTPTVILPFAEWWSLAASVRIPVSQRLNGQQYNSGLSVFVTLGVAMPITARKRVDDSRAAPGRVTLVDYWATWCGPCKDLTRQIEAYRRGGVEFELVRVNVTNWSQEDLEDELPGVKGLPVLEIFDSHGRRVSRLEGPDAFNFKDVLETAHRDG